MQTLISYLHAWGIANNDIVLEPLLRPHNQHYSGALFQVHLVDEVETGVTSLVAVGMALLAACNVAHTSTTHHVSQFASLSCGATKPRRAPSVYNSAITQYIICGFSFWLCTCLDFVPDLPCKGMLFAEVLMLPVHLITIKSLSQGRLMHGQ